MIDSFAATIALLCLLAGLVVGTRAAAGRHRWKSVVGTLVVVEIALLLQGILAVVGIVGGHRPHEFAAHLAYLAVSVALLPLTGFEVVDDDGRWAGVLLGAALLATAVVTVRAEATWRSA